MANSQKILVCGDVQGKFDVIFSRTQKLLNKNKFDMLLCLGDFFGQDSKSFSEYESGRKKVPLPTYILGPNNLEDITKYEKDQENGFEFCENLTYLGKKGIFKTSSGVKIVYLSGCESPGNGPQQPHCFSTSDIDAITSSLDCESAQFRGTDILLTSMWPKGVSLYGNAPSSENCKNCGSSLVSKLARDIKPRYHFSALEGVHYERLPYRNHTVLAEKASHVTRFISLAPVGNSTKQKYLYAFTISPMEGMTSSDLNQQPPDTTESPYKALVSKTTTISSNGDQNQFRWNMDLMANSEQNRKRKMNGNNFKNHPKKQSRPQDWSCWFCLGGEKVEKHLVASVGNLCYVALAKGGLTGDHVLILPIAHHPSSLELPDDTREEVEKFKKVLVEAFKQDGRSCVFFERCYRTDHMQIQVVPLPKGVTSDKVKESVFSLAEGHMDRQGKPSPIEITELPGRMDLKQIVSPGCPFFHMELPDGTRLFHRIQRYFPLQFGREALCSSDVLNLPDRVDWRSCTESRDRESDITMRFREFFKPFDFSAEGDSDED